MDLRQDILECLLIGLPGNDQQLVLESIERAHSEQLERKLHPPRRRRRNEQGILELPPAQP